MSAVWDVAVAGGGVTGLSLALALRELSHGALRVVLIDRVDPALRSGPRTSALAQGPRRMLDRLKVWPRVSGLAQPIMGMEISDAQLGESVRSALLTFGGRAGEPLAHMVFHRDLEPALLGRARESGVEVLTDVIEGAEFEGPAAHIRLQSGVDLRALLVVGADGMRSKVRAAAGVPVFMQPYDCTALVLTIDHEDEHEGVAVQHFFEAGPFASLPLCGRRSSIVWTERTARADAIRRASANELREQLDCRLAQRFGRIAIEEGPQSFPLVLQLARSFIAPRLALVGDAAHRVHPLAGQGLNIGMRDVATLAGLIIEQCTLGLDPGSYGLLSEYERRRRFDAASSAAAFDLIHRAYGVQSAPVRAARRLGMGAVDRSGALKNLLQREASGTLGWSPQLFR